MEMLKLWFKKCISKGHWIEVKCIVTSISYLMLIYLLLSCNTATDEDQMIVDPNSDELSTTPLIDSNTNWLVSCSVDDDCGESGRCACGSCVIPCSPTSGERNLCATATDQSSNEIVECAETDPVSVVSSCGEDYRREHVGICLLRCETNDECPAYLLCHEGRCVRPRRGESRGCGDERQCIEAGGAPERCRILCEDDREEAMSIEREPPPRMREIANCVRHCVDAGYEPEACRSRCAVCSERCLLIDDPQEAQDCERRCSRYANPDQSSED